MDTTRVFVYGTLKQGFGNHDIAAPYVADVQHGIVGGFELWHAGHYPYAVPTIPQEQVHGEVLTLRDPQLALARLDRLEGVPSHYERRRVLVQMAGRPHVPCWMYVWPGEVQDGWCRVGADWTDEHCRDVDACVIARAFSR